MKYFSSGCFISLKGLNCYPRIYLKFIITDEGDQAAGIWPNNITGIANSYEEDFKQYIPEMKKELLEWVERWFDLRGRRECNTQDEIDQLKI